MPLASISTRRMLRGISSHSKQKLKDCIYHFFDEVNANPLSSIEPIDSKNFPPSLDKAAFLGLFVFCSLY